jgi:hypothetical protein
MLDTSTNNLFIQEEYNKQLRKDGVVHLPFLSNEELQSLVSFYNEMHPGIDPPVMYDGIHMTIWHSDIDYKLKIKNRLEQILTPACERIFKNFRLVSPQFIVKKAGARDFQVHQDWSIVDETKYISMNIWIPLLDVDDKNGAMWIVKGSHRIDRRVRGGGYLFPDYMPAFEKLLKYATVFPMKAGELLLFYHSTIHGSPANTSNLPRVSVQISLLPKEAPFKIYFQQGPNTPLEVHCPKDDFSYHYEKITVESGERGPTDSPEEILPPLNVPEVTIDEIVDSLTV